MGKREPSTSLFSSSWTEFKREIYVARNTTMRLVVEALLQRGKGPVQIQILAAILVILEVEIVAIFAVLIPIVGLGASLWWAGRDIMRGTMRHFQNLTLNLLSLLPHT
ncbi:transmembrane protein [Spatholobus suberectus]|nr:transmembrane protein [Spatholobus suberectus]